MPSIFSFFSGIGLLDLGFENAGFNIRSVNELNPPYLQGYAHARTQLGLPKPEFGYFAEDVDNLCSEVGIRRLHAMVEEVKKEDLTGFIGGPPCPDFSNGGKNRGRLGENGRLSEVYTNVITNAKPDFFVFENVKGLWRTRRHREFYEELKRELRNAGYSLADQLVNAIEFGVPQDRERIILIGIKSDLLRNPISAFKWDSYKSFPGRAALELTWPATEPPSIEREMPLGIAKELTAFNWFADNNVTDHPNAQHRFEARAGLKRFQETWEGDTSHKSFKRLHRWRYSPTAAYGNNEVHIHPWESRRISVAEALAIQSLPSTFQLPSAMTLTAMFKAIGNGVPYLLSNGIAKSLLDFLNESVL